MASSEPVAQPFRPAPPPPQSKEPWQVDTFIKLLNLAWVVVLGTFIKCGTDSFSQNMERGKLVKDLLDDLSTRKSQQEKVRQDISLLALDRFLVADQHIWNENWLWNQNKADRNLVANIAAVLFDDIQHDSTKQYTLKQRQEMLGVIKMVMQKNDSAIAKAKLNQSYQAIQTQAISRADLSEKPALSAVAPPVQAPEVQALNGLQDKAGTPLVYIQYRNAAEEAVARQIQAQCQQRNWKAPGIELITSKTNFDNSIRYYHLEDRGLAMEASKIAQSSLQAAYPQQGFRMRLVNLAGRNFRAPTGQVEVWINTTKPAAAASSPAPPAK